MSVVLATWTLAGFLSWPAMEYLVHGILAHRLRTFVSPLHHEHRLRP